MAKYWTIYLAIWSHFGTKSQEFLRLQPPPTFVALIGLSKNSDRWIRKSKTEDQLSENSSLISTHVQIWLNVFIYFHENVSQSVCTYSKQQKIRSKLTRYRYLEGGILTSGGWKRTNGIAGNPNSPTRKFSGSSPVSAFCIFNSR